MNRRFKLLTIVATIAMTMFGTMVCRAEASAKTNVQNECCSAEKDDDNKVHFVAAFATKTQYKLPQKQSAAHHKFKV